MLPESFQFNQSNLQDYADCARRFQLRYIDQLRWPAAEAEPIAERERHLKLGQDFHQAIHQHIIGIPQDMISTVLNDPQLVAWWGQYLQSPYNPQHESTIIPERHYPEITLAATIAGFRVIAKLDLLALEPGKKALILDWKSAERRPSRMSLEKRWQTLVYRYLLVEAGAEFNDGQPIAPEQVEMIYWFTAAPDAPEHFAYDAQQHESTRQTLSAVITEIANRQTFDLTTDTRLCRFCVYRSLCERGVQPGNVVELDVEIEELDMLDFDFSFDQVAEVEF